MIRMTRHRGWHILGAALLALATIVPSASAQDEPAFVFPCADGVEWEAAPDQPISFLCGWGTVGGPGLIQMFLRGHQGSLVIEDENGKCCIGHRPCRICIAVG
jgi:hypothetical protein